MPLTLTHTTTEQTAPSTALTTEVGCLLAGSTLLGSWLFIELIVANAVIAFGWPRWLVPLALVLSISTIGGGGLLLARWLAARGVLGRPRPLLTPTCTLEGRPPYRVRVTQFATHATTVEAVTLEAWAADAPPIKRAEEGGFIPSGQSLETTFTLPHAPQRVRLCVYLPEQTLTYTFEER